MKNGGYLPNPALPCVWMMTLAWVGVQAIKDGYADDLLAVAWTGWWELVNDYG